MKNLTKPRCSFWGIKTAIIASVLLAILSGCGHGRTDTDYKPPNSKREDNLTCSTSVSTMSTSATRTTIARPTTKSTTTMETTTLKKIQTTSMTSILSEPIQETIVSYSEIPETEIEIVSTECSTEMIEEITEIKTEVNLPITDQEFILLANVVSHEAGSSWITEYNRACIVAAIMNRVADSRFPNTIDEVVHQPGQMFDVPYYRVDYSTLSREEIDNAVYAYFNGKYEFGNFNSWSGDGTNNYFYYQ